MHRTLLAVLVVLALASAAWADGKMFQRAIVVEPPTTPDQRALLVFDEARELETLVVETTVEPGGDVQQAAEFAWVLPLPAWPQIEASTTGLFPSLEAFCAAEVRTRPDPTWIVLLGLGLGVWGAVRWWRRPFRTDQSVAIAFVTTVVSIFVMCGAFMPGCSLQATIGVPSGPSGAQVLERQTVGVFDTTTLTATDAPALRAWLTDNGFAAPESIDPVVTELLDEGWVFVASKVSTPPGDGAVRLHPLSFTFPTSEAVYPMRLTGVDAEPLELSLFVCGARRAEADGLDVLHCEDDASGPHRTFHDEYARRTGGAAVLTKLAGRLDAEAMTRDVHVRWTEFDPHTTTLFTAYAASHAAAFWGVLAGALLLLIAAFRSRRVVECASRMFTRFDAKSFAAALVVGGIVGGISFASLPRLPVDADLTYRHPGYVHSLLWDPPNAILGDPAAVRAWVEERTKETPNVFTNGPVVESDSPGNWWLRESGDRLEIVTWQSSGWGGGEPIDVSGGDVLHGTVRTADGAFAAETWIRFRASVPATPVLPGQRFVAEVSVRTLADGSFVVHLPVGQMWDVAVVSADHPYALREGVDPAAGSLDVALPRAASLRGRVLNAAGEPVAGAAVHGHPESPFDAGEYRLATTDADGWFEIHGLDAESDDVLVTLHVREEGEADSRGERVYRGRIPPAEPIVLRLAE